MTFVNNDLIQKDLSHLFMNIGGGKYFFILFLFK